MDYYNRQRELKYSYEGEDYSVTIAKVIICPQCYSAVASRLGNMKGDYLIVDIGSKTTDVLLCSTSAQGNWLNGESLKNSLAKKL